MSPPVYRYDAATFTDGEVITSRGDHLAELTGPQRTVEMALRNFSPEMAEVRSKSLYVWLDREGAERLWRHSKKNEHLYELDVDRADIRHVGDVGLFTLALQVGPQETAMEALVRLYWNQIVTRPAQEILVAKATVRRKLFDVSEK